MPKINRARIWNEGIQFNAHPSTRDARRDLLEALTDPEHLLNKARALRSQAAAVRGTSFESTLMRQAEDYERMAAALRQVKFKPKLEEERETVRLPTDGARVLRTVAQVDTRVSQLRYHQPYSFRGIDAKSNVRVLVNNPKRGESARRFALYGPPGSVISVTEALARGIKVGDLVWDSAQSRRFIEII